MCQYNNLMFCTAGVVAEKATGMSWENLLRTKIFGPLQMNRTTTSVSEAIATGAYAVWFAFCRN